MFATVVRKVLAVHVVDSLMLEHNEESEMLARYGEKWQSVS